MLQSPIHLLCKKIYLFETFDYKQILVMIKKENFARNLQHKEYGMMFSLELIIVSLGHYNHFKLNKRVFGNAYLSPYMLFF